MGIITFTKNNIKFAIEIYRIGDWGISLTINDGKEQNIKTITKYQDRGVIQLYGKTQITPKIKADMIAIDDVPYENSNLFQYLLDLHEAEKEKYLKEIISGEKKIVFEMIGCDHKHYAGFFEDFSDIFGCNTSSSLIVDPARKHFAKKHNTKHFISIDSEIEKYAEKLDADYDKKLDTEITFENIFLTSLEKKIKSEKNKQETYKDFAKKAKQAKDTGELVFLQQDYDSFSGEVVSVYVNPQGGTYTSWEE